MERVANILKSAFRDSRLVFLIAFLAVVVFHGVWWYERFHLSAPFWLIPFCALPWWYWAMPLIDGAPPYLRPSLQAVAMAAGFAFNATGTYTLVRAAWLATRPNNSFKPKPLRGSA